MIATGAGETVNDDPLPSDRNDGGRGAGSVETPQLNWFMCHCEFANFSMRGFVTPRQNLR
jgi:hypothetical protein